MPDKPLINLDDVALEPRSHGASFDMRAARVGAALGLSKLGCRLVVIPPGKRGWPYHLHRVNDELFVILSGTGSLRYDGAEYPLRPGDVIGAPAGPGSAHQIVNSGDGELRYLAISTNQHPEIAEYPDTGKFFAMTAPPSASGDDAFLHVGRLADAVDYWDGED